MADGLPTALQGGLHILRLVVEEQNFRAAARRTSLGDFVDARVRFERGTLVGEDVAIEIRKERKAATNVTNGNVVGVRQNKRRQPMRSNFCVQAS